MATLLDLDSCHLFRGTRLRSWLRHYAASWKVVGSISDEVAGGQSHTNMRTENLPGIKGRLESKADNLTGICVPIRFVYECRLRNTCSYSLLLFIATCFGSTEPSSGNVYTVL
jgi:hypothetical protein